MGAYKRNKKSARNKLHYSGADHQNTFCVYGFSIKAQIVIINQIHFNMLGRVVGEYIRSFFFFFLQGDGPITGGGGGHIRGSL